MASTFNADAVTTKRKFSVFKDARVRVDVESINLAEIYNKHSSGHQDYQPLYISLITIKLLKIMFLCIIVDIKMNNGITSTLCVCC